MKLFRVISPGLVGVGDRRFTGIRMADGYSYIIPKNTEEENFLLNDPACGKSYFPRDELDDNQVISALNIIPKSTLLKVLSLPNKERIIDLINENIQKIIETNTSKHDELPTELETEPEQEQDTEPSPDFEGEENTEEELKEDKEKSIYENMSYPKLVNLVKERELNTVSKKKEDLIDALEKDDKE